jgi:hypothetical protein
MSVPKKQEMETGFWNDVKHAYMEISDEGPCCKCLAYTCFPCMVCLVCVQNCGESQCCEYVTTCRCLDWKCGKPDVFLCDANIFSCGSC